MDATQERALYNSWLLTFSKQWKHKFLFISISISEGFDCILIFGMLYNQKQANIDHHVFYLVMPHEIYSCENKIIDKGPVLKKAKVASSSTFRLWVFFKYLFYGNHFTIVSTQKVIFWKIELGALHGFT